MLNRKAQVIGEEIPYWLLYIPITAVFVAAVAFIPVLLLSGTIDTHDMENAIFAQRIYNQLGQKSALTGRVETGRLQSIDSFKEDNVKNAFDTAGTPRMIGFKLTLEGKEIIVNKQFYEDGVVLAKYARFIEVRPVLIVSENRISPLTIDQVFTKGGKAWTD
jgi:hypothetical protein